MEFVIDCECGKTLRAGTEDAILDAAEAHIEAEHPVAAGAASREDLLAMAHHDEEER